MLSLLKEIDDHEAESTRLTAEETELKARLFDISNRQGAIMAELDDLSARVQATAAQHEDNMNLIAQSKSAHDFSLPVVNAAIMSWEQLKSVLDQLPELKTTLDIPSSSSAAATDVAPSTQATPSAPPQQP